MSSPAARGLFLEMTARPRTIVCDAGGLPPTVETVDRLARLQLAAKRVHAEVRLRNVSSELAELVGLAGLGEALGVEAGRQPEDGEERAGVEEEGELDDPSS